MGPEETPDEFVNQLTFKRKLFGGCDEEDILLKMYQVCDVYKKQNDLMQEYLESLERYNSELENVIQKAEQMQVLKGDQDE